MPVSVPPMTEKDREEWHRGFGHNRNAGYFPEEEFSWDLDEDYKEMTMWDVFAEMVVAAKDKMISAASFDLGSCGMSVVSTFFLQEAWKDMAQTLADTNSGIATELLETEPTKWLPDSAANSCMLCEPQRVCDVCGVRLESIQPYLMNEVSRASQLPTQDVTDLSTLRSWLNFPWAHTMEYEIYKAANSLCTYCKVGRLKPEKAIPDAILKQAKGLAIVTVAKVGMMVTYKVGTGLVIARRADGSWSPPSAFSTCGIGYGAQAGGEIADFIIVLRNTDAIKTFSGKAHLSVGAGVSASAGHLGRVAEADFRAGDGGYAACYTYSCSKGAFVGCAFNGSIVSTRDNENARFYGGPVKGSDILLGSMARPPAASPLYKSLSELFDKMGK
ncbi:hypothetical protein QOZ80_2BG0160830 [Eleusine coracana subsp. coracana]|nr:hypothetical protein QOZ80_2BG0160830 [Eleusine coracana subsp. coracana]